MPAWYIHFLWFFGSYMLLRAARGFRMHRQARRKIREYFHEKGERILEIDSTQVFGPRYDSIWKAATALVLHYDIKVQTADGAEAKHTFSVEFAQPFGAIRGLHRWGIMSLMMNLP